MRDLLAAVSLVALLSSPALATGLDFGGGDQSQSQSQGQTQGQNQGQSQGQTAYGGSGTGVGIAGAAAGAKSRSSSSSAAIGVNDNTNRNSLTTKQLNEQQIRANQKTNQDATTGDQSTNVDASSDDDTKIPVGSVISYTYVPNTIPQAVIGSETVVTSWTVHVLDPLFGMSDQHVHMVPSVAVNLGTLALDTSTPQGTASAAYICAKDSDYADALGVHCY